MSRGTTINDWFNGISGWIDGTPVFAPAVTPARPGWLAAKHYQLAYENGRQARRAYTGDFTHVANHLICPYINGKFRIAWAWGWIEQDADMNKESQT